MMNFTVFKLYHDKTEKIKMNNVLLIENNIFGLYSPCKVKKNKSHFILRKLTLSSFKK